MQNLRDEITSESLKWEHISSVNQAEAKVKTNVAYLYPLRY